jgi:hypothetical protein
MSGICRYSRVGALQRRRRGVADSDRMAIDAERDRRICVPASFAAAPCGLTSGSPSFARNGFQICSREFE